MLAPHERNTEPVGAHRHPMSRWPFLALAAFVTLSGCGGGSGQAFRGSETTTRPVSATTSTIAPITTTSVSTTSSTASSLPLSSTDQLTADLTKQTIAEGRPPSSFVISATISTANSSWAEFAVKPSASVASDTFASYTGFAHLEDGFWTINVYGTPGLNCSLHGQPGVPTAVLAEFGWFPSETPSCFISS